MSGGAAGGSATATDRALAAARKVLRRAPLFDGHNDLPWTVRTKTARGDVSAYDLKQVHEEADTDIPRLREGMVGAQFWAAFQPTNAAHPARTALEQIDLIRRMEEAYPDAFEPARRAADYAKAKALGKIASFIAVEGGVGLENSLAPLRIWHAAGVRLMTLCHNESLDWVDSATDAPRNRGISAFGRAVVAELNRLGVVIDLAHASHDAMRQVLDVTEAPVMLSHCNAYSLCDHPRNAPDDVLRHLKPNRGLVMATFVPGFVSQALRDWQRRSRDAYGKAPPAVDPKAQAAELEAKHGPAPKATLEQVADHIDRLIETAGVDHVGIGSDYFGGPSPAGLENVSCFPHLFAELVRRGYSERDLEKIASRNALRVLRQVESIGRRLRCSRPPAIGMLSDYPGA